AIWDATRRRVLIARDRLGIKPLYFSRIEGGYAFASTIDAVLATGASREIDTVALAEYLRFQKVPEPRTIYRAIRALPPGCVAIIDLETGAYEQRKYSMRRHSPERISDAGQAEAHARAAFERAVASHLVADVEVAAF